MGRVITVGSRQSRLALTQTGQVIDRLKEICLREGLDCTFEIKKILTRGDQILDVTLSKVGGKGLFVKEIQQALLQGEIDFAVHSMKDMPSELPEGLMNGATPKRIDPRDALISRDNIKLADLREGAIIGTSSLRRAAQLKVFRPDFEIRPLRGNIDTRLRKLEEEGFDAIILATAGLIRVGWEERVSEYLPVDICIPAIGQGALGIECRTDDAEIRHLLQLLNDPETERTVQAERSYLATLNGGCQVPIGGHAVLDQDGKTVHLTGIVGTPDGSILLQETMSDTDPTQLGIKVAEKLIAQGADRIIAETIEASEKNEL